MGPLPRILPPYGQWSHLGKCLEKSIGLMMQKGQGGGGVGGGRWREIFITQQCLKNKKNIHNLASSF